MDPCDIAGDVTDAQMAESLRHQKASRKPALKPCSWCYNCTESIGSGELFCSLECRADWQQRKDASARDKEVHL